jgi:hypothetical protein
MGLFDIFSGSDEAAKAAAQNAALYQQYGQQANNLYGTYGTQATGALGTGLDQATGALGTGLQSTVDALKAGQTGALGAGQAGVAAYTPLSNLGSQYGGAVNAYYDALGLNGPGGVAATQARFTTSPAYQFQQDEAARAATNAASKFGLAGSGNTLSDILTRSSNIAKGEYGSYLDRLGSFVNPQLQATSGAASGTAAANANLANIYNTGATNLGSAYTGNATNLAGLYSGQGQNLANVYGNVAQGQAGALRDVTGGQAAANNMVAQAGMQDAANLWNTIGAIGGGVASGFGGGLGKAAGTKLFA